MAPDVNLNRPFDPRLFLMDQELDRGVGLLLAGASELTRAAEAARRKAGLSKPEMQILMTIRYWPGLRPSRTCGTLVGMTVPTFARILGQLDQRSLIEKEVGSQRRPPAQADPVGRRRHADHAADHRAARAPAPRLPQRRTGRRGRQPPRARRAGALMPDAAHILVVDDDDRIRDLLKRFLSREGYRVTAAHRTPRPPAA
jgi:CheY-like chemotaxis protein